MPTVNITNSTKEAVDHLAMTLDVYFKGKGLERRKEIHYAEFYELLYKGPAGSVTAVYSRHGKPLDSYFRNLQKGAVGFLFLHVVASMERAVTENFMRRTVCYDYQRINRIERN